MCVCVCVGVLTHDRPVCAVPQTVHEAQDRHNKVDAQNDQLRDMLVAAQERLDKAEADARSHETLLRSMQAERDHLQMEMRKQLTAPRPVTCACLSVARSRC